MNEFKFPQWKPFNFPQKTPHIFYPSFIQQFLHHPKFSISTNAIIEIFWEILAAKSLKMFRQENYADLYQKLMKYEITIEEQSAFISPEIYENAKKRGNKSNFSIKDTDLLITYYILNIFYFIGKLPEYLASLNGNRKKYLENYILNIPLQLKINSRRSNSEILYIVTVIYLLIGNSPRTIQNLILNALKSNSIRRAKNISTVFQLLLFRLFNLQEPLKEGDILLLHQFQKPSGGFNFKSSALASPNDTFWIAFALESYNWFITYRSGPIFSYILNFLRKEYRQNQNNVDYLRVAENLIPVFQMVVLYSIIFDSLMIEVEKLLFSNISKRGKLNIEILSNEGGFSGAEQEIISLINQKFQFKLEILDNDLVFRRFLNQLNPFQEKITIKIHENIRNSLQFDINDFTRNYNRNRSRINRIKPDLVISLIRRMEEEYFFSGRFQVRRRFLLKPLYIYHRDDIIEKIIVCDHSISWQDIQREKRRIEEIVLDIFNMINEIKNAKQRITLDVESMIIVGMEPAKIEEQMKFMIKNTLIQATFFQKNIESFSEELVYLNPKYFLQDIIQEWDDLYQTLQSDFGNIRKILNIKLEGLKDEIRQQQLLSGLEQEIFAAINQINDSAVSFEENFRQTFEQDYKRELIGELTHQLNLIEENLQMFDKNIKTKSLKITSKKPQISKKRKNMINKWISQKENLAQLIHFYRDGFSFWENSLSKFDELHRKFTQQIKNIEDAIKEKIAQNDYSAAFEMNRSDFTNILQGIKDNSQVLEKEINQKRKSSRKLNPLYQTLFVEWNSLQYSLERQIQEKKSQFHESITVDQQSYLREKFDLFVDSQITALNQQLINFKQRFSSLIKRGKDASDFNYSEETAKLQNSLKKAKSQINREIENLKKSKIEMDFQTVLQDFENFSAKFLTDIDSITQHYENKKIISQILKLSEEKNQNIFEINYLAQYLKIPNQKMESLINHFISHNMINAKIFGKPSKIEIHNKNWRTFLKIKQKSQLLIREIQAKANMCHNFFNNAVINHEFLVKAEQLNGLIEDFYGEVKDKADDFEKFLKLEQADLTNVLINQEYLKFYENANKIKEEVEKFQTAIKAAKSYQNKLYLMVAELEDNGNSLINIVEAEIRKQKKSTKETHGKFLHNKWDELKNDFEKVKNQAEVLRDEILQSGEIHEEITLDIEDGFTKKLSEMMQYFQAIFQNFEDELKTNETLLLRNKMDNFIIEKQNEVNDFQRKLDLEIKNKIRSRDFIIAAKKLNLRSKQLQKTLKKAEKEIKNANKEYKNISRTYGVRYSSYILEEWLSFQKQFEESVIDGLYKVYTKELVYSFTDFSIKSLKESFVPLKLLSDNLLLNHDQIQHYLMALISEGMLPGKIDIQHDVYFEGTVNFDEKSVARLEIIKKTNVKTYLRIQRLRNIFGIIGPILTGFASFLTILWYLIRLSSNLVFIAIPVAAIIILFIFLWIRRGREQLSHLNSTGA